MAIEKIDIEKYLQLSNQHPVIDVRSPGEFKHAHFPNAYSLPLFNDEERKIVGTTYKQQSREDAIKIGLDFFGVKMRKMVEEAEKIVGSSQLAVDSIKNINTNIGQLTTDHTILIHCWRGGMRSTAVAWLLDLYGFKVYTLAGGYKAFRNWVLKQFEKEYNFKILGGFTGSGKTIVLEGLKNVGQKIIDLEKIANHKGSAFGALGEKPQTSQEMFENLLAIELSSKATLLGEDLPTGQAGLEGAIWLEDESQRIGKCMIPNNIWNRMRNSKIYFLDISFEERLNYLVEGYGKFSREDLENSIIRIQKRLGGLETQNAINFLQENNIKECFSILLKYYDKLYAKGLKNRENYDLLLNIIPCLCVNTDNVNKLPV
jgi:tRNA 2-selenouridine synthase